MTVGSGCFRSVLAQFKRKQVLMTSVFLYQGESFATQDVNILYCMIVRAPSTPMRPPLKLFSTALVSPERHFGESYDSR